MFQFFQHFSWFKYNCPIFFLIFSHMFPISHGLRIIFPHIPSFFMANSNFPCFFPIFSIIFCIFHGLPITIFSGKIHHKWPFSIATLNYQRVIPMFPHFPTFSWGFSTSFDGRAHHGLHPAKPRAPETAPKVHHEGVQLKGDQPWRYPLVN